MLTSDSSFNGKRELRVLKMKKRLLVWGLVCLMGLCVVSATFWFTQIVSAQDEYSPVRYGVPDVLAGYQVLAVVTEQNAGCLNPGEKRLVLQGTASSPEELLATVKTPSLFQDLIDHNIRDTDNWTFSFVGPDLTRKETVRLLRESYAKYKQTGCIHLGGPIKEP